MEEEEIDKDEEDDDDEEEGHDEISKGEEEEEEEDFLDEDQVEPPFDPYANRRIAREAMLEDIKANGIEENKFNKSLASSHIAKKKLVELFEEAYQEEEGKLPPPRRVYKLHQKIYRSIKRRVLNLPLDEPPLKLDIDGFMNDASRDRYGQLMTKIDMELYPEDLKDSNNRSGLWYAALNGCDATVGFFLNKPKILKIIDEKDSIQGWTPLAACCTSRSPDQLDAARRLMKSRANVDIRDNRGRTPLMIAIICNNLDLAELLIEFGASLDKRDRATWMPIHHAAFDDNLDAVELLLENRCRYKRKDQYKMRALDWAERKGHYEIADILRSWDESHISVF